MMNIHYIQIPTDYADKLLKNGEAEKFHAFLGYFYDLQKNALEGRDANSIRYYGKRWGTWVRGKSTKPKSNSLVVNWLEEFDYEIERYYTAWSLVNSRNTARVKNSSIEKPKERSKNAKRTPKEPLNTDIESFEKSERTPKEHRKNKEVNINDDDKTLLRDFENLFFVYRAFNGSYTGNKNDGLQAYKQLENILPYLEMEKAIKLYFQDNKISKHCGIGKFFSNNVFLDYTTKRVSVLIDANWIDGSYIGESFVTDAGEKMVLSAEGFARMFAKDEVRLLDLEERVA